MKIRVSNIDRSTSEDELFEIFEEFGEVTSVTLNDEPDPGRETFSAIVIMPSSTEAREAILELNGENIDGRNLRVVKGVSSQPQEKTSSYYDEDEEDDDDGEVGKSWEKIRRRKPPASSDNPSGGPKGKKKR
ncbi:MAG: RNA-binding protein [Bacteroidia bacterium]|nr:RNA-binding protein [Bacteroidia bacterium]